MDNTASRVKQRHAPLVSDSLPSDSVKYGADSSCFFMEERRAEFFFKCIIFHKVMCAGRFVNSISLGRTTHTFCTQRAKRKFFSFVSNIIFVFLV